MDDARKAPSQNGLFARNLSYNLLGAFGTAALKLAFVPVYLNILGIEAYGLIAFSLTLQATLQIFDLGLSPAMNREMARLSISAEAATMCRDFVRTIEIAYWALGFFMGVVVFFSAPLIATNWINASSLNPEIVTQAVKIMGCMVIFQWPLSLYQAGLLGLQRQGVLNALNFLMSALQNVGAALVLFFYSSTVTAFFIWLAFVSLVQVICTTILLWYYLPHAQKAPQFNPREFRSTWKFAAGMSGIALCGMILSQTDKVLLSKLLPLAEYGYYMLAITIVNVLMMVVVPLYNAAFPQFAKYSAVCDEVELRRSYRLNTQIMVMLVTPIAMLLVLFGHDLVLIWTFNSLTAEATAPLLTFLAVGTALNGIMYVPYALQLAQGDTSIGLTITIGFIITMVPSLFFMADHFGALGVASVWAVLNIIYVIIGVPLTHRTILVGESGRWFKSVLSVILCGFIIAAPVRYFFHEYWSVTSKLLYMSAFMIFSYLVLALVSPDVRHWLKLCIQTNKANKT